MGKSTLFNRLCGFRKAIVGDEPGITRDRMYGRVEWRGRRFEIMDTGGLLPDVHEVIPAKVLEQAGKALAESDLVLMMVDGRTGPTALDEQLLPMLRRTGKPIWIGVNKIDTADLEGAAAPFYAFGVDAVYPVSAEHSFGVADLLDALVERAGEEPCIAENSHQQFISVAVVGRPNVGKSSLVNRLLGLDRVIVSELPGTTRDAVDTTLNRDGTLFRIVDTAGIRRKGRTEHRTEKISVIVARKNLEQADVALLLIDAEEGVTKLDAAIGGYAEESGCSVIIVLNKWDKVARDTHTVEEFTARVRRRMKYLQFAPILTVSATTGQRVSKLFEMIRQAYEGRRQRIPTGVLNHLFVPELAAEAQAHNPAWKPEIRYITQVSIHPPTFVVFTTGKSPLHFSSERHLQNQLREKFGFFASPIRIRQRLKRPSRQSRNG